MASGIGKFLKEGSVPNKVKQFEKLSQNISNKSELRELEQNLLTPEPIPDYIGEELRYVMNSECSVKFVFASPEEMEFFGKYIPIAEYREKSITNIKIILDLFRAMEDGTIVYDKKAGTFHFEGKPDSNPENEQPKEEVKSGERKPLFRRR